MVEGQDAGTVKRRTYALEGTPAGQVVPPIKFSIKVPDNVRVHSPEAPLVGLWDPQGRTWSTEHVSEVSYSAEDRTVRFQVPCVCVRLLMSSSSSSSLFLFLLLLLLFG